MTEMTPASTPPTTPPLVVSDLSFHYDGQPVLDRVDVVLEPGMLTAIIGPNGAGKSTLLKNVLGLLTPDAGTITFFGYKKLHQVRSEVVYVPQRADVDWSFPITVLDVAMQGQLPRLTGLRRFKQQHRAIAVAALERVGMADFADKQISELSGGQQQRVFLARAIAQDGEIFILDEPFAGVDYVSEELITAELKELRRRGKSLLIVHHDLNTLDRIFDRVIMLNRHVVACGPIALIEDSELIAQTYRAYSD